MTSRPKSCASDPFNLYDPIPCRDEDSIRSRSHCENNSECHYCEKSKFEYGCYENAPTTTVTTTTIKTTTPTTTTTEPKTTTTLLTTTTTQSTTTTNICTTKIACNRDTKNCSDYGCDTNYECKEFTTSCIASSDTFEDAGKCPSKLSDDPKQCSIHGSKQACILVTKNCAWCNSTCVTDNDFLDEGDCPDYQKLVCKNGTVTSKQECKEKNCAWCSGKYIKVGLSRRFRNLP